MAKKREVVPDREDAYSEIGATAGPYKETTFPPLPADTVPEVGSENDGSNPPALPCATEGYSRNIPGEPTHTQLSKPANTSSASVSSFLSGGR